MTTELALVPEGADASALETIDRLSVVRYDDRSEVAATLVGRGLRAVPPRRVFALGRARGLQEPIARDVLISAAWAVRAGLLPDRARPDPLLADIAEQWLGALGLGVASTPLWFDDSEAAAEEARQIVEYTDAAVENPACFTLLTACSGLDIPAIVLLGATVDVPVRALAAFLAGERRGAVLA